MQLHINQAVKEKINTILEKNWTNDYLMYDAFWINAIKITQIKNCLEIDCEFYLDPSDFGESGFELFKYDDTYFPVGISRHVTSIGINWTTLDDLLNLNENYLITIPNGINNSEFYAWNSLDTPDLLLKNYMEMLDDIAISDALINEYNAKNEIPSFIPKRLHPYLKAMIRKNSGHI